jgi:hypothetical protein
VTRLGRARLARRLYLAAPGWSAVVGILVVLVSGLLVAAPRAASEAAGVELRQAVADIQGPQRDLVAETSASLQPGSGAETTLEPAAAAVYGALDEQLRALADTAAPDLRERLGEVDYLARGGVLTARHPDPPDDVPIGSARVALDPHILDRVEIVEGVAPAPASAGVDGLVVDPVTGLYLSAVEVMMSADSAETLGWDLGPASSRRTIPTV